MSVATPKLAPLKVRRGRAKAIFDRLGAANPNPRCELYYETPYQLLISVVLSAHTTDKAVNRCMEPLYKAGFGPDTVLAMGEERFREVIRSVGLAPTKARHVLALTRDLVSYYQGRVPDQREALEALPGVGRKTANVVLGEVFGQPTLAVDTHVFRVSARLGLQAENSPDKAERALLEVIDPAERFKGHHWLLLHGRYVCKAQNPQCATCVLRDLCSFADAPRRSRGEELVDAKSSKRRQKLRERQADDR